MKSSYEQGDAGNMSYSNTAMVALLVHCIVNYNALRNRHYRNSTPAGKMYRWLMLSVAAFYVFDAFWGVLYEKQMLSLVFADTVFYFLAMTATVFIWSRFVIRYLRENNRFIKAMKSIGWFYLSFVLIILFLNCFMPVMFWFDQNGVYHAGNFRYLILAIQIILFLFSAIYVLITAKGETESVKRHNLAIASFGITMAVMVIVQVLYPLLPFYSIGCLLGTSILHTFVLEDIREDRRLELEEMMRREEEHKQELGSAKQLAYKDSLTGVKNKHAYAEWEENINTAIHRKEQPPFAVVICDINNLKTVNDLYGHKEGDVCIQNACAKICAVFSHSPVFRVGGDEFAVILAGEDYVQRKKRMEEINAVPSDRTKIRIGETVSAGMCVYDEAVHTCLQNVFEEADKAMYKRKQAFKTACSPDGRKYSRETASEYIPVIHDRKHLLIADDLATNRELMGELLRADYDLSYAGDGEETIEILRAHKNEIDLLLLDLLMPKKNGMEVLAEMQLDEDLMSIPVIFLTVDQNAELDCLRSGAFDFIPKPFPNIEIVKARIARCIELSEDRELIRYTERDKLTGLLNKDYFIRYVSRLDHIYKGKEMDAMICDINQFHSVNKQYGRQFGDHVLRTLGTNIRMLARKTGGIGCRQGGDAFLLYCPHQDDYEQLLKDFLSDLYTDEEIREKISLRFGVFTGAEQEADPEERFVRAKIAAERVKDDPEKIFGFYDIG